MSDPATLADAFVAGDREAMERLLSPETVFRSPVAKYTTAERVLLLLTTITGIVEDRAVTSALADGDEQATFFTGRVGDRPVDGVLHVLTDGGRCTEITLMLRPLDALLDGVKRMQAALEEG